MVLGGSDRPKNPPVVSINWVPCKTLDTWRKSSRQNEGEKRERFSKGCLKYSFNKRQLAEMREFVRVSYARRENGKKKTKRSKIAINKASRLITHKTT